MSATHEEKAFLGITVTPSPILTLLRAEQLAKANRPSVVTLSGMATLSIFLSVEKDCSPISVSPLVERKTFNVFKLEKSV